MRTLIFCSLLLPALAACNRPATEASPPPPPATQLEAPAPVPSQPAAPVLSAEGFGKVRFGASLAALQKEGMKDVATGGKDPACHMARFAALPGVRFMVENGVVTRADADPGVANALGVAVGDTLADVTRRHPALEVGPHKYVPAGHYLTMKSQDGRRAIVMEEDGKGITKIRAGLLPSVSYVETCL